MRLILPCGRFLGQAHEPLVRCGLQALEHLALQLLTQRDLASLQLLLSMLAAALSQVGLWMGWDLDRI